MVQYLLVTLQHKHQAARAIAQRGCERRFVVGCSGVGLGAGDVHWGIPAALIRLDNHLLMFASTSCPQCPSRVIQLPAAGRLEWGLPRVHGGVPRTAARSRAAPSRPKLNSPTPLQAQFSESIVLDVHLCC